jgi:hypothetical protein
MRLRRPMGTDQAVSFALLGFAASLVVAAVPHGHKVADAARSERSRAAGRLRLAEALQRLERDQRKSRRVAPPA